LLPQKHDARAPYHDCICVLGFFVGAWALSATKVALTCDQDLDARDRYLLVHPARAEPVPRGLEQAVQHSLLIVIPAITRDASWPERHGHCRERNSGGRN